MFGGDGCDWIISQDGGDVLWGGDCDPSVVDGGDGWPQGAQLFFVVGTGTDPENYTVIMDFWHESAMPYNHICMGVDEGQGACTVNNNELTTPGDLPDDCVSAVDLQSGRDPTDTPDPARIRNSGCKNDGGPLWVSVQLLDESNRGEDETFPRAVYGRVFQKKSSQSVQRRSRRRSRYA